jgi:hypothetical protein
MKTKALLLIFLALVLTPKSNAYDLLLMGKVKDAKNNKPIVGCDITILTNDTLYELTTDKQGEYSIYLPLDRKYEVTYKAKKYFSKNIEIDTRNIPEEDKEGGFEMHLDGNMIRYKKKINADVFTKPMARCKYEAASQSLEFDMPYTQKRMEEIAAATQKKPKKKATTNSN